jgi:hypothetical protein
MTAIIGADAAKLAGLQIDALTKYRGGQLSLDHLERFLNLSSDAREERFGDSKKTRSTSRVELAEKFSLLADLGTIVVPEEYAHSIQLESFAASHRKQFSYFNEAITDENFPNPSRIMMPGQKYRVRAWKQIVPGTTTSEERMTFLAGEKSVHVGAQGASLVFEEMRNQLPKGYWYASFDEKERLWKGADGYLRVPSVNANSGGGFRWHLGYFEGVWFDDDAFLSFCDESA